MSRMRINFIVDSIAFVLFISLTVTGIIIHYLLPSGSGHFLTIWDMNRHEWGQIHFWMAAALLTMMVLHIFLHWRWVICTIKGENPAISGNRLRLGFIGVVILTALAISPFISNVERSGNPNGKMRSKMQNSSQAHFVRGSMTLFELEQATGISYEVVLKELNIPIQTSGKERLGHLRKYYSFEIGDVREIIKKLENK